VAEISALLLCYLEPRMRNLFSKNLLIRSIGVLTISARLVLAIGVSLISPYIFAQTAQDAAPPAPGLTEASGFTAQGLAALKANQAQAALDDFQKALAANPDDVAANLLASTAALSLYQSDLAVRYAEKAKQLDPTNWKVHTTLVAAYAAAGRNEQRDQERETLRKLHADPNAPDAMQTSGFLLEMFPVKQYRVEAVEYFKPVGKFHTYYRFVIRNAQGKRVWQIDAQSNDFDEKSWAAVHAEEAAAGKREFQLVGEDADLHTDYSMFSSLPDYDSIRARAVSVIEQQTGPFPGEK
jgi:tetratricopeptide (TPR) repeat protein